MFLMVVGIKRDASLLKQVSASSSLSDKDSVTALDISFDKNVKDVNRLLDLGVNLFDNLSVVRYAV
jgi:hypothetical protein